MKKVLFAINNLEGGGAEKVLVDLVNNLNKKKYTVDLFLIDKTGVFLEKLDKDIKVLSSYIEKHLQLNYMNIFLKGMNTMWKLLS